MWRKSIRLTLHTDYALRILLHAAIVPGERLSIAQVAVRHLGPAVAPSSLIGTVPVLVAVP